MKNKLKINQIYSTITKDKPAKILNLDSIGVDAGFNLPNLLPVKLKKV